MFRRRQEDVPFAFISDADRFRSNVAPPSRRRGSPAQFAGQALVGVLVAGGLIGALVFGMPAMRTAQPDSGTAQHTETSQP